MHVAGAQRLYKIVNYLTASDWQHLRCFKRPLANKIQVVVDRWVRLGLTSCDEWTFAWGVGVVVLSHFDEFPLYSSVFAILHDMKESFSCSQKPAPVGRILEYPRFEIMIMHAHVHTRHACRPPQS